MREILLFWLLWNVVWNVVYWVLLGIVWLAFKLTH